jgi:DNA-binding response OmpR family regulator
MARRTAYVASRSAKARARIRAALDASGIEVSQVTDRTGDVTVVPGPGDLVILEDSPATGIDALALVRSLQRDRPDVTVIAVTARGDSGRVEALLRAGASACVINGDIHAWKAVGALLRGDRTL